MKEPKFSIYQRWALRAVGALNIGVVTAFIHLQIPFYKYSFHLFCALFYTWMGFSKRFVAEKKESK